MGCGAVKNLDRIACLQDAELRRTCVPASSASLHHDSSERGVLESQRKLEAGLTGLGDMEFGGTDLEHLTDCGRSFIEAGGGEVLAECAWDEHASMTRQVVRPQGQVLRRVPVDSLIRPPWTVGSACWSTARPKGRT